MKASFWHQKWERGDIAFHEAEANPLLTRHFGQLHLPKGSCVFLPLCGKTRDIAWLLANGYRIAGAELSEIAITDLFKELGIEPDITPTGKLTHYSARDIDIWAGDIFDLTAETLGAVHAIYDRAALVALPAHTRKQYTSHLTRLTRSAPQLLITYEYDQSKIDGPPFSITTEEVKQHYGDIFELELVESQEIHGGLKGKVAATETIWLLHNANRG